MAKKSSQTFAKRQRELARKERQQRKAEKKLERRRAAAENPDEQVFTVLDGPLPIEDDTVDEDEDEEANLETAGSAR